MLLILPIYVHLHEDLFTVWPLFAPTVVERHGKLERVLFQLARTLRAQLNALGKALRHEELARYSFCPDLEYRRIDLALELRRRVARGRFFFVLFEALGRRLAFTPAVPELWFEVQRGESLTARATEVLTHHFRALEKEDAENFTTPESVALQGTAWITTLDLDIYPSQELEAGNVLRRAALSPEDVADGERELYRVGRCLDQLYPEDLDRVLLRDRQVEELTRWLRSADRRPVLLLGPPLVGKTALLHEYVYRSVAARKDPHRQKNNVWLLAPQRLISGMSYVGQWEQRLLAILKVARKHNHILYFDDFLGLYYAGRTSQSDLSVAHVLKPYVERREIRLVCEMTPEAFRVLRERDRGFADLFHLLPLHEPSESETLRILIAVLRQLEGQHRCQFALDVLPTVLDLQRRYVRHLSFPGKAALFLRRLAVKHRKATISREEVLREFQRQSGLALTFLDPRTKLERQEVVAALEKQVLGQPGALNAAADVVSITKARLNDPDRPLASFLFLGPTGVGKTQCAKALADYLFGAGEDEGGRENDPGRLLRFDMNEFLEAGSAARLVGTFFQPEGLLTAAVRRRPFAVVLFDEIEKAHPEVLDLLLQVLGEGRLTDALGRTVDFTSTILILTSNLGVREAQSQLGYRSDPQAGTESFIQAAERYFRPEFFNRLDRIVPFNTLGREEVGRIARMLLRDLLQREGLVRRKSILLVQDSAMERIVDQGFDPILGARALKRTLERHLTHPIATRLVQGLPEALTLLQVYSVRGALQVEVAGLEQVPVSPAVALRAGLSETAEVLERCKRALWRMESAIAPLRPEGEISSGTLAGEHYRYFQIRDALNAIRGALREWDDRLEESRLPTQALPTLPLGPQLRSRASSSTRIPGAVPEKALSRIMRELAAAQDLAEYLEEVVRSTGALASAESALDRLLDRLALTHLQTQCVQTGSPEEAVLLVWSPLASRTDHTLHLAMGYRNFCGARGESSLGLEVVEQFWDPETLGIPGYALHVRGLAVWPVLQNEVGTHLFCPEHEGLIPVQVFAWPLTPGRSASEVLREQWQARQSWQERLQQGEQTIAEDPLHPGAVVRIYNSRGNTLDLRTGRALPTMPPLRPFVVAALALPPELSE